MVELSIYPAAQAELDAAMAWYEERSPGLGLELLDAVDAALAHVRRAPATRRALENMPDVRRVNVRRFPFAVIYRQLGETLQIVAVAHHHRRPGYWQQRLEN